MDISVSGISLHCHYAAKSCSPDIVGVKVCDFENDPKLMVMIAMTEFRHSGVKSKQNKH